MLTSSVMNTVAKATSEWQLQYKTAKRGKKTITVKTELDKAEPGFDLEVSVVKHKTCIYCHLQQAEMGLGGPVVKSADS